MLMQKSTLTGAFLHHRSNLSNIIIIIPYSTHFVKRQIAIYPVYTAFCFLISVQIAFSISRKRVGLLASSFLVASLPWAKTSP